MSVALGLDGLPSYWVVVGGLFIICGAGIVLYDASSRTEVYDATPATRERLNSQLNPPDSPTDSAVATARLLGSAEAGVPKMWASYGSNGAR